MPDLKTLVLQQLEKKTQTELAMEIGVSQGMISNASTGIVPRKLDVLEKFARFFNVTVDELRGTAATGVPFAQLSGPAPGLPRGMRLIPVINHAACGKWRDFGDLGFPAGHADRHELAPTSDAQAFYVIAAGDSMIGGKIEDGDLLLVEPSKAAHDGDIVLARTDKGCTVKKFFRHDGHVELRPMNEQHKSLIVKDDPSLRVYRITRITKQV